MSIDTKIEYADATINWWAGCAPISPACDNCYAKPFAKRLFGVDWGTDAQRRQFQGAYASLMALDRKAKRLGRPLVVFHNSLSDFFDNAVPVQWRIEAMRGIVDTPNLIHLLVTKRIGNAAAMLEQAFRAVTSQREGWADNVLPNVYLIATISNQTEADRDIAKLLATPAAKRGLSMEPLLGPVDLTLVHQTTGYGSSPCSGCGSAVYIDALTGASHCAESCDGPVWGALDWVIVGGESGANARPMHPDWVRSLRDQCQAAGVPFFFKQWGEWAPSEEISYDPQKEPEERWIKGDGSTIEGNWFGSGHAIVYRVGKKAAGRLLDGCEWNGAPT